MGRIVTYGVGIPSRFGFDDGYRCRWVDLRGTLEAESRPGGHYGVGDSGHGFTWLALGGKTLKAVPRESLPLKHQ